MAHNTMKLRVDLLRHGETQLGQTLRGSTDDALTELGWSQMQNTIDQEIEQSGNAPWSQIYTSPLQRCSNFADALAIKLNQSKSVNTDLQEMHFGDWEGISTAKIYEEQPELLANFWQYPTRFHAPNGESLQHFQQRVLRGIEQICLDMHAKRITRSLLVTHGGVIKLLKCIALNRPLDDLLKMTADLGKLNCFEINTEDMQIQLLHCEFLNESQTVKIAQRS